MEQVRNFRSRLNTLPVELKVKIGEVSFQVGMRPTSRRDKIISLLNEYGIPFKNIGTGTNRHIVKYDGYALKIALDDDGIADNRQEWAISEMLQPNVAMTHEISKGGHLLVASYAPAFTSHSEMYAYATSIKRILKEWGSRYLIGDVGLNPKNFANWGLTSDGRPVCIDYAYIFPASMDLFQCYCGNKQMTFYDGTFSSYKCTNCGRKFEDSELRWRITPQKRAQLFENVSGIAMKDPMESHPVDQQYIKLYDNPDMPDPYEVEINVANHLSGGITNAFR